MTGLAEGYTIHQFRFEDLPTDDQVAFLRLFNSLSAEREPRHTDYDREELIGLLNFPGEVRTRFLVRDPAGQPIAHANVSYADDGSNADRLRVAIAVERAHRRKGVGSALLEVAAGVATTADRSILTGFVVDIVPAGNSFVDAIGGGRTMEHQSNVLPLADLSRDLMEDWVDQGPMGAPDYSVQLVEGAYPEHILDQLAHLYVVLERDMPTPEGQEPAIWSADRVAAFMDNFLQIGDMLTALAFTNGSGEAVGISQLYRRSGNPRTWIVTTTMVDPAHRGHGLGKWLKGAVNLAAIERWPDGEYAETGNAKTNTAMLAINRAMGFRTESTLSEVAVSVEAAEQYLSSRRQTGGVPGTSSNGG